MGKKVISTAILVACMSLPGSSIADPVHTLTITQAVVQAAVTNPFGNFVNYRIEGLCFWLHWSWHGPYVVTTLRVNEFLPDAVVSVYTQAGSNPWLYANQIVDPIMQQAGDLTFEAADGVAPSSTNYNGSSGGSSMEIFKEVDIIGDPALPLVSSALPFALIPSVATPLMPYYSSLADTYLWRTPEFDNITHPQNLIPGIRTEGSLINEWGSIFPRIGYVNQLGDYKAAAVLALRAADIATNSGQARVYNPLSRGCGTHCTVWPSHENDFGNVKYQEIYPVSTTSAEETFGVNDLSGATYNQSQLSEGDGNYVWVMWRHYEGCIQDSGSFIGET